MVAKAVAPSSRQVAAGVGDVTPRKTKPKHVTKGRSGHEEIRSFLDVFRAEPLTRVRIIKGGVSAAYVDRMAREMGMPKERLLPALGLSPATVNRRARESKKLSTEDSERVVGMARLVGQVQSLVNESGDPKGFNAAEWVARWLEEPLAALGGQRPVELMDTTEGQAIVANLIARVQSGAYA
jgi:putative toxin-antitoxin system antitoxin component (TIGR02293 family)